MRYIENFNQKFEILNERKNYGDLYHFTSLINVVLILNDNYIRGKELDRFENDVYHKFKSKYNRYVSLTRNKKFIDITQNTIYCSKSGLCLDSDKLTDKYRLTPYNDFHNSKSRLKYGIESEESVLLKGILINDIKKYIKYLIIPSFNNFEKELYDLGKYRLTPNLVQINYIIKTSHDESLYDDTHGRMILYNDLIDYIKTTEFTYEIYSK